MPIKHFGVVTGAGARCATPDDRGWRDLGMLGMQVAFWLDGKGGEPAMRVAQLGVGTVVCPEAPLLTEVNGEDAVDLQLLQRLTGELVRHGAARRACVVLCADGSRLTGLLCGNYQLAMGEPLDRVLEDQRLFAEAAGTSEAPYNQTVREFLSAMALARAGTPGAVQ